MEEEEKREKGNDIAFRRRERKGMRRRERESEGLYLGRPGWGFGEVKGGGGVVSRHGCWRERRERGGWGSSPSSCPLTDELGSGPGLKGLGRQTHTHTHECALPWYLLSVDEMPPWFDFVQRRKRTRF